MFGNSIEKFIVGSQSVIVFFDNNKIVKYQDCWLKDNCRCHSCYYFDKNQRALSFIDIPDVKITKVHHVKTHLLITWSDKHESIYSADFLLKYDYERWITDRRLKPVVWYGKDVISKVSRIHVDKFLYTVEGTRRIFQSILDYGFAFVEDVDPTIEATEKIVIALGGVQHSLFGGMWSLSLKDNPVDLAYTNLRLTSHTDSTYFEECAGLQTFHCIQHTNGTGGETTLVDGFYGALRLKEDHPEDYNFLTEFDVEYEYKDDNNHATYSAPVIRINSKTQDILQVRIKMNDRAPMAFSSGQECRQYYKSLRNLTQYYEDPTNQIQFKLRKGTVLIMDNFRILHGRTAFSGHRILCGGSVTRTNWLNKARMLKLIH